jgi:5-methylcytosine-specific restriction protein A
MSKKSWHHLYKTKQWKELRAAQLRAFPLCAYCLALGMDTAANVADHRKPHKGDRVLFFDATNLQSLCTTCHDAAKQTLERTGVLPGCTLEGHPLDPAHHWSARGEGKSPG